MAASHAGGPATGRKFPTGANYVEALQNPTLCFEDPDLKQGTVQQSPVLGPKAISGNFASVFSVTAPSGQRYALKCFTRESSTLETRYRAISDWLAGLTTTSLSQPWPVRIKYLGRGVLVAGQWYPALKMAWAEGTNLISWIERNLRNTAAVLQVSERFTALIADLEKLGIAHGDLQHGNLLVAADGTLRLVDYDGMYVPALKGQGATENGHRNYQSPARTSSNFGPGMDRFSSWIIHLALVAIAIDPSIWDQLHEPDGEFLILREEDFKEPNSSLAWNLLLTHPDPTLQALAAHTRKLLSAAPHAVPALSAVRTVPVQRQAPAASPTGGTPSWLAGHIPSSGTASGPGSGTAPAPSPSPLGPGFVRRRALDLLAGTLALAGSAAPGVLSAVNALPTDFTIVQTGALLASGGILDAARRSRPEARASKLQRRTLRQQVHALEDPGAAAKKLQQEIEALAETSSIRSAQFTQQLNNLQVELRNEQARVTTTFNKTVNGHRSALDALDDQERKQREASLAKAVTAHVQNRLRLVSIRDVKRLSSMGSATVAALMAANIHTAADFIGVRYVQSGRYTNRDAFLIRPNNQVVKVQGIGEVRATALEGWRASQESKARKSAPTALGTQERTAIRQQFTARKKHLEAEIAKAETAARQQREQVQKRIVARQQQINTEKQQHLALEQQQRAALLHRQAQLADVHAARERLAAQLAAADTEHRRNFGLLRYLRFLTTGS